jgi:DNA methylase
MGQKFFSEFDFDILDNPEFEESSVREEIINPILHALNYKAYGRNRIIREKAVTHPFVQTGSGKREITNFPDYLLEVSNKYSWVMDAKGPNEDIKTGKHKEQAYFYAIHPEIRVKYYALCNGREFILFHISEKKPLLYFQIIEIDNYWEEIKKHLAPDAFVQKEILEDELEDYEKEQFDYDLIKLPNEIAVRKQAAKRHFGVHGYFTKQAWNVVQHYILNFTQPGDLVLDPFGGGGSTLVESLMTQRKAVHIDLNPLSVFITASLVAPVDFTKLNEEFEKIKQKFTKELPQTDIEIEAALKKYSYPKNIALTKDADVDSIEELFTDKQLAQLAFLKYLIIKIKNNNIRNSILLSFSSTITKINRTYHASKSRGDNAGNAAAFAYYRYRIAKEGVDLDVFNTFEGKYRKLVSAKQEMSIAINEDTISNAEMELQQKSGQIDKSLSCQFFS